MTIKNTKDTHELKKEVSDKLNKVNRSIDRIEKRTTPGQFLDDVIFYPHGGNPKKIYHHLKENPIGASFLALGTLLLMEDDEHKSYESTAKKVTQDAMLSAQESVTGIKEKIKNKLDTRKIQSKARKIDQAKGTVTDIKHQFQDRIDQVKSLPPFYYIALGAGLGAVSGAALPVSTNEQQFVDHQLSEGMTNLLEELKGAINESANIIKSEFVDQLNDIDVNVFKNIYT